jgi:phage I-like protein
VVVNHATEAALKKNNRHPFDNVVVDFCHATEKGGATHPIPTAAYGTPEVVPGEGLFLVNMQWTPDGERAWKGKWYKDVSPTIARNKSGEVVFVKSAALCFNGRIPGAENFDASTHPQDEPTFPLMKKTVLALLAKSGVTLPEDATDEQIAAAADQLDNPGQGQQGGNENFAAILKRLEKLDSFEAKLATLETAANKQNADSASQVKKALLDQAARDGQVIPFSNETVLAETFSVDLLRETVKNLPKGQVPFVAGAAGAVPPTTKPETFSAEELAVYSLLGIETAQIEKFGMLPDKVKSLKEIPAA